MDVADAVFVGHAARRPEDEERAEITVNGRSILKAF